MLIFSWAMQAPFQTVLLQHQRDCGCFYTNTSGVLLCPLHNRAGISSQAGSYCLTHWETQQRLCSCGTGELSESLPLPFMHSSNRKLPLKGLSTDTVTDKHDGILKAFKKNPNTTFYPFPVFLAKS